MYDLIRDFEYRYSKNISKLNQLLVWIYPIIHFNKLYSMHQIYQEVKTAQAHQNCKKCMSNEIRSNNSKQGCDKVGVKHTISKRLTIH